MLIIQMQFLVTVPTLQVLLLEQMVLMLRKQGVHLYLFITIPHKHGPQLAILILTH